MKPTLRNDNHDITVYGILNEIVVGLTGVNRI